MSELLINIENGVSNIVLNRPESRNALNAELLSGLRRAFRDLQNDSKVRVITLTGSGSEVFCAGADLKSSRPPDEKNSKKSDYRELLLEIRNSLKPTVALARGHVMAGGLGLFLACDLALACDDVHYSTPEINVGMFPMMVLALLVPIVGRRQAAEMAFSGEKILADRALSLGLVNHIYPRNDFERLSQEFVSRLAGKSGAILKLGKKALRDVEHLPLTDSLTHLEKALENVMLSEDSKEGIRAFVEKRKPQWKDC